MIAVTPIGSCRIAGPLGIAAERFGFTLNRSRSFGYCHTSLEAVQQARFLQGDYHSNSEIWPLISQGTKYDDVKQAQHVNSDIYVVEISSAKQVAYRGHAIQLNYLRRQYPEFFNSDERAKQFWEAAALGNCHRVLKQMWGGKEHTKDREVLSDITLRIATRNDIAAHLKELKARLPNLIVVTHIDAKRIDSTPLAARSELIADVKAAARMHDVHCFNPTSFMQQIGQSLSMDPPDSLTHYTPAFSNRLATELMFGPVSDLVNEMAFEQGSGAAQDLIKTIDHARPASPDADTLKEQIRKTPNRKNCIELLQLRDTSANWSALPSNIARSIAELVEVETLIDLVTVRDDLIQFIELLNSRKSRGILITHLFEQVALRDWPKVFEIIEETLGDASDCSHVVRINDTVLCQLASQITNNWERLAFLHRLERIDPANRKISAEIKSSRRSLRTIAQDAFKQNDTLQLEELEMQNNACVVPIDEIKLINCRAHYRNGDFRKSAQIARSLTQNSPYNLNSWILSMRSEQATGQFQNAINAANKILSLAESRHQKYLTEAQELLSLQRRTA